MNNKKYIVVPLLALSVAQPVLAELTTGGSIRVRYESKNDYNFTDAKQDYALSQLRLNALWKVNQQNDLFIELQDSRVFGEELTDIPAVNENARNQPFADPLDIHQAYWKTSGENYTVKVGRQKLNLGDMRLVASLEWVNTARVHDGIRLTYNVNEKKSIDFFATSLVSVDPEGLNDQSNSNNRYFDSQFHGIYVTDKSLSSNNQLDYWWFYRGNSDVNDSIHTFGAKYLTTLADWKVDVQGSIQTGEYGDVDHSAQYFHAGINKDLMGGNVGFAYNYASGDSNPEDNEHNTFDNLYPLNHAYYGFMDLFSLQNIHNLEAVYKKKGFRVAYQMFWLADTEDAWYNAGLRGNGSRLANANNSTSAYVGSEVDITYKMKLQKNFVVVAGVSSFFAGDYVSDTGSDETNPVFFFLQSKYSF